MHRPLITAVVPLVLLLGWAASARAQFDPVTEAVVYVITKAGDELIVDPTLVKLGLKPDVDKAIKQLAELEKNTTAFKSEQREALRQVKDQIAKCATRDDLKALASDFRNNLGQINQRVNSLEDDREKLEVKVDDLQNGSKYQGDPDHFLYRGERRLADKDYFRALANARVASSLDPNKPEPYLLQGKVYAAMGTPDVARVCYDQAIKAAPKYGPAYQIRADARLVAKDFAGAVEDYGRAVQLDPKDAWSWTHRGQARFNLGQYAEAIDDHTYALELNADDAGARYDRGRAYVEREQFSKAIADFDAYIQAQPQDPYGYDSRGYAQLKRGDLDDAQADLEKAFAMERNNGLFCGHMTELSNAKKDFAKAAELGKRAVELYPGHWKNQFQYALALKMTGKDDEALPHFKEAIRLNPKNQDDCEVRANAYCGLIYDHKGDSDNAILYLTSAIAKAPDPKVVDGSHLLDYRASAYNDRGEYAKAIDDATAALKNDPDDGFALTVRAIAHSGRKEYSAVVADYTDDIRVEPKDSMAFGLRGDAYRKLGKNDKAIDDYTEAIRLDPKHEYAYDDRGQVYRLLGKTSAAVDDFVQALKSPNSNVRDDAVSNLIDLQPDNSDLQKALPLEAHGTDVFNAFYTGLLTRIYVPDDKDSYGSHSNYGYSSSSSYKGHSGLPAGYWVYEYPYWYIWQNKK